MGAQGKDGAEGVDGAGYVNAATDVRHSDAAVSRSELVNVIEEVINLRTENDHLRNELNRVIAFVNKQDKEIEEIAKDAANLWHYHNEHAERLDGLWNAWNDITNRLDGV